MKRALVTGASGFVGANVARRLLQDGHEVHVVLRQGHQSWRLDEITAHIRPHGVDIQDSDRVAETIREIKPDWVFHLAAYGAYSHQAGLNRTVATNLLGTAALLNACVETGVESFVHTGSSSEYGYKDHAAHEYELIEPNSVYAITKAGATHYCQLMARTRGIHAVTLRLYSIYGPYEEPTRLIPTLILHGLNGRLPPLVSQDTARDFVHVDDAVEAILRVAASSAIPAGTIYNVASGVQTSIKQLVDIAIRQLQIAEPPVWGSMASRKWDTDVWVGAPEALSTAIGWSPLLNVETGLRRTIDWFRNDPRWLAFYSQRVFG